MKYNQIKAIFIYSAIVLILFFAGHAWAEEIPTHIASMAAQLYKGVEKELDGKNLSAKRQKVLKESIKTLRGLGVHRWSCRSPKISWSINKVAQKLKLDPKQTRDKKLLSDFFNHRTKNGTGSALSDFIKKTKQKFPKNERAALVADIDAVIDSAVDKLKKIYVTESVDGQSVQMKWNPNSGTFFIKVLDDGLGTGEQFAISFAGDVNTKVDKNGEDILLEINPFENPINILTDADIKDFQGNIFGTWRAQDGTLFKLSAEGRQTTGKIHPPREFFNKQIEQTKEKIKIVKNAKIFEWYNSKTKEIIQQKKFHNLKEPFRYLGEKYVIKDAKEKIANFESKITELESQRDRNNLAPVDKYDPGNFGEVSSSDSTLPITITVTLTNGHVYTYDEAVFNGRSISAKRTYKVVLDFCNQKLPGIIKRKLLDEGWNPSGWLELDTSIDAKTGRVILDGRQWSMMVTYSSFFGGPPDIDRIHTPYSWDVILSKDGASLEVAEGAAKNILP